MVGEMDQLLLVTLLLTICIPHPTHFTLYTPSEELIIY